MLFGDILTDLNCFFSGDEMEVSMQREGAYHWSVCPDTRVLILQSAPRKSQKRFWKEFTDDLDAGGICKGQFMVNFWRRGESKSIVREVSHGVTCTGMLVHLCHVFFVAWP